MATVRSQVKLDQILAAAQKQFCRYGLAKTTMNDIAEEIGMSKASLYYYFVDKERLFTAVVVKEQEHFLSEMQKLIDFNSKYEWLLKEYVLHRIELFKKLITPGKFSFESYLEIKPFVTSVLLNFRKKEIKMVSDILKIGIKGNEFTNVNVKSNVEFFLHTLRGIRQIAFAENALIETTDFNDKKHEQIKNHSLRFTELFIKGLKD